MPTKIQPALEQSQQGISIDLLVSIEGVEESKRNVWIKVFTMMMEILQESTSNKLCGSLKSLDLEYLSKNHARKLLQTLLLKWRSKVTTIEEAKDLATLPLDELIGNIKVYEMVLDNDGVGSKTTKEKVKSLALKAKVTREQTSDESDSQGESDEDIDEARNFRKFFRKGNRFERGNRFGNDANRIEGHFASECRKRNENKAFIDEAWSDSEHGDER
nr:hypothetical protein [Tanacetum cinerariifolium]